MANKTASPAQAIELIQSLLPEIINSNPNISQVSLDALILVLGNCPFLARWTRRFPEKVIDLLKEDLWQTSSLEDYQKRLQLEVSNLKQKKIGIEESLIHFKYKEIFRICYRDIGLKTPFEIIAKEISLLAQSIVQFSLKEIRKQLNEEWGKLIEIKTGKEMPYTIMAMGKLGGYELNFSSDIDLICFYASDQGIAQKDIHAPSYTAHQYFTKLTQELNQLLSKKQEGGFLYRVDLELRPEGKSGPLVNSIDAMETYYESFGAPWEKQAMIRANYLAGSESLFKKFIKRIHPFVYPKMADFSFLKQLKEMKEKIHQSLSQSNAQGFHVKLGQGGIREIEFFVQSFQLLFGGRLPDLQGTQTLSALSSMVKHQFISSEEAKKLKQAYIFLRTLENRLQQVEEQQVHRLPEDLEELNKLAIRMGYDFHKNEIISKELLNDLEKHRQFVGQRFASLFDTTFGGLAS